MKRLLPLALILLLAAGCASKSVTKTKDQRYNAQRAQAYGEFVARRTSELQLMGGPFKDRKDAEAKARSDADSQFGGMPAEYTTTTTWGKHADAAEKQAEFNEQLEKMSRDKGP